MNLVIPGMLSSDFTNVYSDSIPIAANMENNRNCLRRIARHDETEFSNQSIMNAMEKFVKAVNDMDENILVPCRLMDLKVGDAGDSVVEVSSKHSGNTSNTNANKKNKSSLSNMKSTDLFALYTMVNTVKNELLWCQNTTPAEDEINTNNGVTSVSSANTISPNVKGHVRRPSTVSMTSTNSTASISDSDSEAGNENDSGIETEDSSSRTPDYTQQVAENFRRHLRGLHRSLEQMTETAHYLSKRYQDDVGGAV